MASSVRERGIEILKMRGMKHSKRIHPYEITGKGIEIDVENPIVLSQL
jgi:KaiC/GvpD/RAD55 family RecA-like ATPase